MMKNKLEDNNFLSLLPFKGILKEVGKIQGSNPAMVILYNGNELVILKHQLEFKDELMSAIMATLSENIMKAYRVEVTDLGDRVVVTQNNVKQIFNKTKAEEVIETKGKEETSG